MRELKFRAWNAETKEIWGVHRAFNSMGLFLPTDKPHIIIMQWTGLLDKNGKEVFEGDIVKANIVNYGSQGKVEEWVDEVAWDDWGGFYLKKEMQSDWGRVECEILGNIYQNPELMEGK